MIIRLNLSLVLVKTKKPINRKSKMKLGGAGIDCLTK